MMHSNVSLLRRLAAICYDLFLVFSLIFFITGVIIIIFNNKAQVNNNLFYFVTTPLIYFYFSQSWVKGRQTLGMKAWRFQVVDKNYNNISYKQAFLRFILAIVSIILMGSGFLYKFFNKNNLTIHDKYSNTFLIKL